jgi:5-methylcytosine-specific restriction endonuclease McrA
VAINSTPSDSANTAVRSFLTAVGQKYYEEVFATNSGKGKVTWGEIVKNFDGVCAYCNTPGKLIQVEHLVMFNREQCGLHHPGNCVPCCKECNTRKRDPNKNYLSWEKQLLEICEGKKLKAYKDRHAKISSHIQKYKYPDFSIEEKNAIRVIAESLYENVKIEAKKSLDLYNELHKLFATSTAA